MTNWTLVKTSLWHHEVIKMNFTTKLENLGDTNIAACLADGKTLDFSVVWYGQSWAHDKNCRDNMTLFT